MNQPTAKRWILPAIVISQFFCTSLWFAGNAILEDLIETFHLEPGFLANLTSAVQFGFITGTLFFAIFTIADRFSPSRVFFICSIIAAAFNLGILIPGISSEVLLLFRFLTGFFLAGIYPVGMKIAADHFDKGLGKSLGFLVGALVLGTAFPHLLRSMTTGLPWKYVILASTTLSLLGGIIMLIVVPDGPFRKPGQRLQLTAFLGAFRNKNFRSSAFGYFGHMWELYTFWAFVPIILTLNSLRHSELNIPLLSFLVIASGGIACMASGILSQYFGPKKIATVALFLSFTCCLLSPLFILTASPILLISFLLFWGLVVTADSPMFSTLVAQNVAPESKGTSLTIVNCIGFAITIVSIQFTKIMAGYIDNRYLFMLLAIGPFAGLIALFKNKTTIE